MRLRQLTEELVGRRFILEVQAKLLDKYDGLETKFGKTYANEPALFVWAGDMAHGMDNLYLYYEEAEDGNLPSWKIMNDSHVTEEKWISGAWPIDQIVEHLYDIGLMTELANQAGIEHSESGKILYVLRRFIIPHKASIHDVSEVLVDRLHDPEEVAEKADSHLVAVTKHKVKNEHNEMCVACLLVKDTGK